MLAIELVRDAATKKPDAALAKRTAELAYERGLLLLMCGLYSNVVRILVPLLADDADVDEGLTILEDSLAAAAG
jgi:4-aminobutyrate aminotransferase/(S)-3-amino-2-methylpropionate transaminase